MSEWFEKDAFWIETYPFIFTPEREQLAEEQIEKLLALAGITQGAALDLCCGPGRHSLPLARRGLNVTGVDRTEYLLQKARDEAARLHLPIEFVQEDMRRFVRPGAYHLALNMLTSFGYFEDPEDDLTVLRNVCESLRPGGAFLIDLVGKEIAAARLAPTTSVELPDGALLIERHEVIEDWSRMRNQWIVVRGDKARSFEFKHRLYSGQELKTLLQQAGFAEVALYGDLDGNEYGASASRLIALARKAS